VIRWVAGLGLAGSLAVFVVALALGDLLLFTGGLLGFSACATLPILLRRRPR